LIDAGIRLGNADALRMAASKIAGKEEDYSTIGKLIQDAFAGLKDKLPLKEDRKVAVAEAVESLTQQIGYLPVARTEPFFYEISDQS